MMFNTTFGVAIALSALLFSSVSPAEQGGARVMDLEPAINGAVSATGHFPTQAMEDAYNGFIVWTEGHGLSGDAAMKYIGQQIEPAMNGGVASRGMFPSQSMEDQYRIYLDWARANGLSDLYAFERVAG